MSGAQPDRRGLRDLCVVIPMKDPGAAKTRLGDTLPGKTRAALTRTLFRNTLRVLGTVDPALAVVVVTNSVAIHEIAAPFGVHILADPGQGLNAAVDAGAEWAADAGYARVCVLPGDLADPLAEDFATLFTTSRGPYSMVIAPAHDGGTNALLVSPPRAIQFAYGPGSYAAHQSAAEDAKLSCVVQPLPSLLYDVDRSADLGARLTRGLNRSLGAFA
jgi:2-phospho-L-lactate guanylyltransferase